MIFGRNAVYEVTAAVDQLRRRIHGFALFDELVVGWDYGCAGYSIFDGNLEPLFHHDDVALVLFRILSLEQFLGGSFRLGGGGGSEFLIDALERGGVLPLGLVYGALLARDVGVSKLGFMDLLIDCCVDLAALVVEIRARVENFKLNGLNFVFFAMKVFQFAVHGFCPCLQRGHGSADGALGRGLVADGELKILVLLVGPANEINPGKFLFKLKVPPDVSFQKPFFENELFDELGGRVVFGLVGGHPAVI